MQGVKVTKNIQDEENLKQIDLIYCRDKDIKINLDAFMTFKSKFC
jgi:hypothetical protein